MDNFADDLRAAYFRGKHAPASLKLRGRKTYVVEDVEFPGQTCPGLIEAGRRTPRGCGRWAFPGQTCPGLIEAVAGIKRLGAARGFPGQTCPGLIEASPSSAARSSGSRYFRGKHAPASLKLTSMRRWRRMIPGFPGQTCPGLIEAPCRRGRRPARSAFPGQTCPGLIEAMPISPQCGQTALHFRGKHAPASLKPDASPSPGWRSGTFPGQTCPGLIEALTPRTTPRPQMGISGANMPRPH